MNDVFPRTLSAALAGSLAIVTAGVVARKSAFYRAQLQATPGRGLPLDGLRGLMAWSVFIHHTDIARQWLRTGTWSCDSGLILFLGKGAVLVFFMITGFLFWGKAVAAQGRLAPLPLWLGRLRRLAPLYALSAVLILVATAGAWLAAPGPTRSAFLVRLFSLGIVDWSRLPGYKIITANGGVQWSLWYEWRFYLALPLLAWFACSRRRMVILFGLGLVALPLTDITSDTTVYWLAFLPGIAAVYLQRSTALRNALCTPASAGAAVAWCVLVLALSHFGGCGWSLLAVVPLFWTVAAGNSYFGALIHPATRLLGTISYSVYLLHAILLMAILKVLGNVIDLALLPLPAYCCLVAGIGVFLTLVCALTYRWVEHPFLVWRTPWERSKPTLPVRAIQQQEVRLAEG